MVKRVDCAWNGFVWLEGRIRAVKTVGVGWRCIVRFSPYSQNSNVFKLYTDTLFSQRCLLFTPFLWRKTSFMSENESCLLNALKPNASRFPLTPNSPLLPQRTSLALTNLRNIPLTYISSDHPTVASRYLQRGVSAGSGAIMSSLTRRVLWTRCGLKNG